MMFPIVPLNYACRGAVSLDPDTISSLVTGSSQLLVPGKVSASSRIAEGSVSAVIEPDKLLGLPDIMQISAELNEIGQIDIAENSKKMWSEQIHWVRAIRLSDDCHSYNVQLRFLPSQKAASDSPKLILQAVRSIEVGQELLLWFSEDVLAVLQIVFLTPANIQGQKKYVCMKCSALYESPNPLKLHISLSCGRHTISSLWEKLCCSIRTNSIPNASKSDILFDFKLANEPFMIRQKSAIDLSIIPQNPSAQLTNRTSRLHHRSCAEPSAFKPFTKTHEIQTDTPNTCLFSSKLWHLSPEGYDNNRLQQMSSDDEAHIETLVSSLGKSRQGHICLYCGKCYSRKYGLKIHIRTHTGYKPLKCKFCLRPFGDPSNLNKHVRLHAEGNTPYKCDLCGKILVRRRDLDRHLRSRHLVKTHPGINLLTECSIDDNDEEVRSDHNISANTENN